MPRKPLAASWGRTAPVAPARAPQDDLPSDPVQRELVLAIRQIGSVEALRRLKRVGQEDEAAVPPPSTAQEVANLASAASGIAQNAVTIAKTQSDLALEEAERERRRRQEAEEQVSDAYERGKGEGAAMLEVLRAVTDTARDAVERAYQVRIEAQQAEFAGQLKALEAKVEALVDRHKAELQARDAKIQELQQENQQLRQRPPSEYEELGRALVAPIIEKVKTHGVRALEPEPAPAVQQPEDPDMIFKRELARRLPEEVVQQHRSKRENEEMLAAEKAELMRAGRQVLTTLVGVARSFVGGAPSYNGVPHTVAEAEAAEQTPEEQGAPGE